MAGIIPAEFKRWIPAPGDRHRSGCGHARTVRRGVRVPSNGAESTTTQRAAELERDRYLAKADELRDDAIMMLAQSPLDECQERYQKLVDAAQAYEDYAGEIYAASMPMALERAHDGRARWVALTIGNTFRTLFGSPMYGLTATIASVVLGREIEPRTVRQWLTYPAVKRPKKSI